MAREELDDVDRELLALLQSDARRSATDIGDRVGVSDTTVLNRIERLEETGVLAEYRAVVNYERAGLHRPFLFRCTVPIADRERMAERVLQVPGVVRVVERMIGHQNLLVEVVGETAEDIASIATTLDDLGVEVVDEMVIETVHHDHLERSRREQRDA